MWPLYCKLWQLSLSMNGYRSVRGGDGVEGSSIWGMAHLNDGPAEVVALESGCVTKGVPVSPAGRWEMKEITGMNQIP